MKRILIIEDDTDINNMTAEFLREKGCLAEQAFSGTEGRLLWQMKEFDLLLLDLMLPGLPGGELLRQIRAASRIPVIVLTAKNSLDDKVELLGGGADDYLTKPLNWRSFGCVSWCSCDTVGMRAGKRSLPSKTGRLIRRPGY